MATTYLPGLSAGRSARAWAMQVLGQYGVRLDVRRVLAANCTFYVEDWRSTAGGGLTTGFGPPARIRVQLATAQHEACIHECGHAYHYWLTYAFRAVRDSMMRHLQDVFLAETELADGDYGFVRGLLRGYRWGVGSWPGMWIRAESRWNIDEVWAGLCSAIMGDMSLVPRRLRVGLLDRFYQ